VHVTDRLLEVWSGNELIKTLLRASGGETRKKRAERRDRPPPVLRRQPSPETAPPPRCPVSTDDGLPAGQSGETEG
jgi:hypothetical protein